MEPENPWPEPPPPLIPGEEVETVESRYEAREVDPRYPPREIAERYSAPTATEAAEAERAQRMYRVARAGQISYLVLGMLEALLITRFVLELLAANPDAAFSSFIYALTDAFVNPFQGVFVVPRTQGAELDLAAVLAMIVYAMLVWGIVSVLYTFGSRRPHVT